MSFPTARVVRNGVGVSSPRPAAQTGLRACVTLVVAIGTGAAAGAQEPGVHPNARYLDAPLPPAFTIAVDAAAVAAPFAFSATPRAAFGSEGDAEADLIGNIKAALLLPSGDVVVLDDRSSEVRIFDGAGRPMQRLGRAGRGPGEFFHLRALAVRSDGRLYVGDLLRRIQVFAPSAAGYRLVGAWQVAVSPVSMCFLGGQLVVQGETMGDSLLQVIGSSGRRIRSFGAIYRSPNAYLNERFGEGMVACDAARGLILYAPRTAIGEVRAYRPDGSLEWRVALGGYQAPRIEERGGGSRVSPNPRGEHFLHSLLMLPGRGLLVQVRFHPPQAARGSLPDTLLHSFLLDPATGRPLPLGTEFPPIVGASDREALLVFDDPVPRFEVRALQQR